MIAFIRLTIPGALLTAASPAFAQVSNVVTVPEPETWLTLVVGLGALALARRCGRGK